MLGDVRLCRQKLVLLWKAVGRCSPWSWGMFHTLGLIDRDTQMACHDDVRSFGRHQIHQFSNSRRMMDGTRDSLSQDCLHDDVFRVWSFFKPSVHRDWSDPVCWPSPTFRENSGPTAYTATDVLTEPRQYILDVYTSIPHLTCLPSRTSHQCHPCWNFPSPHQHRPCMVYGAIPAVYDFEIKVLSFVRYTDQSDLM